MPAMVVVEIDEYLNRGRMFDGRPVYCAEGIRLSLARSTSFGRKIDQDLLDENNMRLVRHLCSKDYPGFTPLDGHVGEAQQYLLTKKDMQAQCAVFREAKLLIIV